MLSLDSPNQDNANAPANPGDNTFRFLFGVLSAHVVLLASCAILGALAWGGFMLIQQEVLPSRYQTSTRVVIAHSKWQTQALKDVGGAALFSMTPEELVKRTSLSDLAEEVARALVQIDVRTGGAFSALATVEEVNAKGQQLEGKITLTPDNDAQQVDIEIANCDTPQEAVQLADLAARVFIEMNRELRVQEARETHTFIVGELARLQDRLYSAETAEWEFKQEMGFRDYGKVDEDMEGMHEELGKIQVTKEETLAKLAELDANLDANAETLPSSLGNVTDGVVDALFMELDTLLQEKLNMSAVYQPTFPGLLELDDRIEEKQRTIMDAVRQMDQGVGGGSAWRQRQDIYQQQVELRLQLTGLEIREKSLEHMLQEMIPQIPELANKNLEYEKLAQETESVREQFQKLRSAEWDIRTAIDQGGGHIERVDPVRQAAIMPFGVGQGNLLIQFIMGGLAGFVCGFMFAMLREVNDTSIRSAEDVTQYIGLDVIGTIPKMRFGSPRGGRRRRATYVSTASEDQIDACIVTQHDPKSPVSEAYRTLRTNFQFATLQKKPKSIMVTSAVPGEGKTTTAVNLAVTMADRGMRVLIVDTDLRRPNVHRVLRMERGPGLSDVLTHGDDYHTVIRPTRIEGMFVISSGRVPPKPSELIASEAMTTFMAAVSKEFDIIICDAPSVLVVTDPVLLATQVDTTIMVVSTNNARRDTVVRAKELLSTANGDIAGVVVNGLETTRRNYYYYYYYYDDGAKERRKWYHL